MTEENILEKFKRDTALAVDAGNCPFFLKWFGEKSGIIVNQKPTFTVEMEAQQKKEYYALYMVMNPKFNRKLFAEAFCIAYGTSRNWKHDEKITNKTVVLINDFVGRYIAEVENIIMAPQGKERFVEHYDKINTVLSKLFIEAAFYKNEYLVRLLLATMAEFGKSKNDESNFLRTTISLNFFNTVMAVHGGYTDLETIKAINEFSKVHFDRIYEYLQLMIRLGEVEDAIEFLELLSKETTTLVDDITFLQTELLKNRNKNA